MLLAVVCMGSRILDSLFDDLFDLVPVTGVDAGNIGLEEILNGHEHLPLFPVRNEGDGDSDTTETTRTTDTVQVSLTVGLALAGCGIV